MCKSKVKINGTYYNCGVCHECRQASANRSVTRLMSEHDSNFRTYFVTLTYDNKYIPYIRKDELDDWLNDFLVSLQNNFGPLYEQGYQILSLDDAQYLRVLNFTRFFCRTHPIAIHRNFDYRQTISIRERFRYIGNENIAYHTFPTSKRFAHFLLKLLFTDGRIKLLESLSGYQFKEYDEMYTHDNNISVCYTPDAINFLKRLRKNLFQDYGTFGLAKHYFSPEYGPTTQRFHMHFLLWLPSFLTERECKDYVIKAWSLSSPDFVDVQLARAAEHYTASYVNRDVSVSEFLYNSFPLHRTSSQGLGFKSSRFEFDEVLQNFLRRRCSTYHAINYTKNGPVEYDLPYPKQIIDRYFPTFVGFNKLLRSSQLHALAYPESFFKFDFSQTPLVRSTGDYYACMHLAECGLQKNTKLYYNPSQLQYCINRINRCYDTYYKPRGISRYEFAKIIINVHIFLKSERLKALYRTIEQYHFPFDVAHYETCDPNDNPLDNMVNSRLREQYEKNVKHRKTNSCT